MAIAIPAILVSPPLSAAVMLICQVAEQCSIIWRHFMGAQAEHPVNVDSKSYKITQENMNNPDRWSFDIACAHLFYLMTSDSYSRLVKKTS